MPFAGSEQLFVAAAADAPVSDVAVVGSALPEPLMNAVEVMSAG